MELCAITWKISLLSSHSSKVPFFALSVLNYVSYYQPLNLVCHLGNSAVSFVTVLVTAVSSADSYTLSQAFLRWCHEK